MLVLRIIGICLSLFIIGLGIEKLRFENLPLDKLVYQLKKDIATVIHAFFSKEVVRHSFEPWLVDGLKSISKPYSNDSFTIDVFPAEIKNTPLITIAFVPKKKYETDELLQLSQLLLLKFKKYLAINHLNWKNFADYRTDDLTVYVYLYYAETPDDEKNIIALYKTVIRQKSDINYGVLQDDDLNKELDSVN